MADHDEQDDTTRGVDFIRAVVARDLAMGKHRAIVTRFPPEPNGYLHIGHANFIVFKLYIAAE
ncbi:MAG: glutamate--tRNA ligase family protein, partial [Gemmatimonadota bacterium]|nr:glutamate--tRNA ligase family protein [Gemmatimonadota bacterium]